jgi:hypothetical protein
MMRQSFWKNTAAIKYRKQQTNATIKNFVLLGTNPLDDRGRGNSFGRIHRRTGFWIILALLAADAVRRPLRERFTNIVLAERNL